MSDGKEYLDGAGDIAGLIKQFTGARQLDQLCEIFLQSLYDNGYISGGCVVTPENAAAFQDQQYTELRIVHSINTRSICGIHFFEKDLSDLLRDETRTELTQRLQAQCQLQLFLLPIGRNQEVRAFVILFIEQKHDQYLPVISVISEIFADLYLQISHSRIDALTRLLNRGSFDEAIVRIVEIEQGRRQQDQGMRYLVLIDLDHFKKINDQFGHVYGDEVLILFADLMRSTFRNNDCQFRFGGEEFVVILNNLDDQNVLKLLERFRKRVENYPFPGVGKVTASMGCAAIHPGLAAPILLDFADQALYYSKAHGRNQINLYSDLVARGKIAAPVQEGDVDLF
jgi:diguanylate cyclase (GGDEF)-like protein